MAKTYKAVAVVGALMLIGAGIAWANGIKVWSAGERISSTDLNANFAHIHNSLRGAGHTLVTNADVSASAAIAQSKVALDGTPVYGFAVVTPFCDGSVAAGTDCTIAYRGGRIAASNSIEADGVTGDYRISFSQNPASANSQVLHVQPYQAETHCYFGDLDGGAPHVKLYCRNQFDGGNVNAAFSITYVR